MTAHSPVGMYPEKFGVRKEKEVIGAFANNDIVHIDEKGTDHELFSYGLKKALFNYMHGICFEFKLQEWFDFKIPKTTVNKNFIKDHLFTPGYFEIKPTSKLLWIGGKRTITSISRLKKGKLIELLLLFFQSKNDILEIALDKTIDRKSVV